MSNLVRIKSFKKKPRSTYVCFHLDKQELMSKDRINNLRLKEDLLDKETSLFRAQSTINELIKDLTQTREEVFIYFLFNN